MARDRSSFPTWLVYIAIFCFILGIAFFSYGMAYLIGLSSLVGYSTIVFAISPLGKIKFSKPHQHKPPPISRWQWLIKIFQTEIAAALAFYVIAALFFKDGHFTVSGTSLTPFQASQAINHWMAVFWGPFPFGLIAWVAIAVGYYAYKKEDLDLKALIKNKEVAYSFRAFISISSTSNFILMSAWSLAFSLLLILHYFYLLFDLQSFFDIPLIVLLFLMFPFFALALNSVKRKVACVVYQKNCIALFTFIVLLLISGFILLSTFIANLANLSEAPLRVLPEILNHIPDQTAAMRWGFIYWTFFCGLAPIMGSYVARISAGRTVREVVLGIFILPLIAYIIYELYCFNMFTLPDITLPQHFWMIVNCISALVVIGINIWIFQRTDNLRAFNADITRRGSLYRMKLYAYSPMYYQTLIGVLFVYFCGGVVLIQTLFFPLAILVGALILVLYAALLMELWKGR